MGSGRAVGDEATRVCRRPGIEPAFGFLATGKLPCCCAICEECRAAGALHFPHTAWLELASFDPDLRRVIAAWSGLPAAIRKAILVLVGSLEWSSLSRLLRWSLKVNRTKAFGRHIARGAPGSEPNTTPDVCLTAQPLTLL